MSERLHLTREEYRETYLKSEHWRSVRLAALKRAEHRCQVCNSASDLDVHHRTYENLGQEKPADLTVLCRSCHGLFHANGAPQKIVLPPVRRPKGKKRPSKAQRRRARRNPPPQKLKDAMEEMRERNAARAATVYTSTSPAPAEPKSKKKHHTPFRPPASDGGLPLKIVRADGTVETSADRAARAESSRPAGAPGKRRGSTRQ